MAVNITHRSRTLFLTGIFLFILGSFLPWECFGDFLWYCSAGLDFNLGTLTLFNASAAIMTGVVLIVVVLILSTVDLIQQWHMEISAVIIASVLLYFLMSKRVVVDNGGFAIIILCSIALWNFFRGVKFDWHSGLAITVTILLAGISTYQIISVLLRQIAERHIIGGTSLQFGLQLVSIGSILIIVSHWWKRGSQNRHHNQHQMGKA